MNSWTTLTPEAKNLVALLIIVTVTAAVTLAVRDINRALDERDRRKRMWMAHPKRGAK